MYLLGSELEQVCSKCISALIQKLQFILWKKKIKQKKIPRGV